MDKEQAKTIVYMLDKLTTHQENDNSYGMLRRFDDKFDDLISQSQESNQLLNEIKELLIKIASK